MAQTFLVELPIDVVRDIPEDLVKGGWDLLPLLQGKNLDITAAFWQYFGQYEGWQLVLATPLVPKEGGNKVILAVLRILVENMSNQHMTQLKSSYILVQSPVSTIVQDAKRKYGKVPFDRQVARRKSLGDDEAYVYLLQ